MDSKGQDVIVDDVLRVVAEKEAAGDLDLEESCFREVTTKNGTRMVLSVSKTFMKLKDLILEKKTLEDQVEKMKAINAHLCSRVNRHEEKLFNITDELNKTWTFVSTLKQQHRKLHESEQILRAELSEKRQLLAKLRQELEYSRESWNVVKKKTADSEREWHALRAEFAARRKLFKSAYHLCGYSGLSSSSDEAVGTSEEGESGFNTDNQDQDQDPPSEIEEDKPVQSESAIIIIGEPDPMTESTITIKNEDDDEPAAAPAAVDDDDDEPAEPPTNEDETSEEANGKFVLVPPLDFFAQVPAELFPPLLQSKGDDEENYSDLYQKLMASTARSAALANRLAEMHRSGSEEEEDEDYEPKTEDDSIIQGATSPDIVSDIASEEVLVNNNDENEEEEDYDSSSSEELEDLGLSQDAIDEALKGHRNFEESDEDEDDTTSMSLVEESDQDSDAATELAQFQSTPGLQIPEPPPQPSFSLVPPPARVTVRPTYNYANQGILFCSTYSSILSTFQARSLNLIFIPSQIAAVTAVTMKMRPNHVKLKTKKLLKMPRPSLAF